MRTTKHIKISEIESLNAAKIYLTFEFNFTFYLDDCSIRKHSKVLKLFIHNIYTFINIIVKFEVISIIGCYVIAFLLFQLLFFFINQFAFFYFFIFVNILASNGLI